MKNSQIFVMGLLIVLLVTSVSIAFAEEITQYTREFYESNTEAYVYTNKAGLTMPYRLFMPHNYDSKKQYPLLLSFHGAGSRGNDNLTHLRPWVAGWLAKDVQAKYPCIILMPQCPANQKWVDTPWEKGSYSFSRIPISKPMKLAKEIFDKVLIEKSVDQSRIYVMGASMGGYGTWNFVMRYLDLVAAAVPMCGAGDPVMAESIKNIPIWAFHGDKDQLVPPSGSRNMVDAIKRAGGSMAQLTIYEGVKHESYLKAWPEMKLVEWIFRQQKNG